MESSIRARVFACVLAVLAGFMPAAGQGRANGHGMVVSIHHDAADAGLAVLKQGGNAVDAAVATGFALAVVHPAAGNLGGGGFMLIRMHDGTAHFLDYRERAPAAASADMYLDAKGNVIDGASTVGAHASGVPGSVAGMVYAEQHFGRLGLKRAMAPAIGLAREGFVLNEEEAQSLRSDKLTKFAVSRHIFQRDGNYFKAGERFVQPELAHTLQRIADDPRTFYTGAMAREIAAFEKANGGLITAADLRAYAVKERTPLVGHYRGYEVLTSPPPSSGGTTVIEMLNMLSGYDLPKLGADRSLAQVHVIAEVLRRGFMDRNDYLGDPDFVQMPIAALDAPAYAAAWRASIDTAKPSPSATLVRPAEFLPAPPQATRQVHESPQTTHFSVVDGEGNAVATTTTLNFGHGSGVTVAGLGFLLNDEMDDFTSKVGVANGFGLVQGPANAIAPGKRPLSSMTPTIVSKDGKLRLVLGTPGGSTIISTVLNVIVSVLDNGLTIQQAADAPRFHHQFLPDEMDVEKAFPLDVVAGLRAAGYVVSRSEEADEHNPGVWGDAELIAVDPVTGALEGGHDRRHSFGKAAAY